MGENYLANWLGLTSSAIPNAETEISPPKTSCLCKSISTCCCLPYQYIFIDRSPLAV